MSASNGRCEFEHLDYCVIPDEYRGYICPKALPYIDGDIGQKCGATDSDLMTEEEWEEMERGKGILCGLFVWEIFYAR